MAGAPSRRPIMLATIQGPDPYEENEEYERNEKNEKKVEKVCLITTGATAEFRELIEAVLKPDCLELLKKEGFTQLNFQCGKTAKDFYTFTPPGFDFKGLKIHCFDFKKEGLHKDMLECQERAGIREKGLVIMHAGTGTVMDAMRLGLSFIVVPNTSLLDNHQDELAQELHSQCIATRATTTELRWGIRRACEFQAKPWSKPSVRLSEVVDGAVGYWDDVSSRLVLD